MTKKLVKTKNKLKGAKTVNGKLDPREEEFCRLYASDREFFANGTQSYIEAFEVTIYKGTKPQGKGNYMTYDSVRNAVSRLLTDASILARIDDIFESRGLNDSYVDKKLEFWLTQQAHPAQALDALKEYNKLKGRITERMNAVHTFATEEMSDTELERLLEEQRKFFKKQ